MGGGEGQGDGHAEIKRLVIRKEDIETVRGRIRSSRHPSTQSDSSKQVKQTQS